MLKDKNIVLGVTGGIAAYKACDIINLLRKEGATIWPIMTENATEFITPLTIASLANRPVAIKMFEKVINYDIEHISLAERADVFLIAPATANMIWKIATGGADDLLSTTVMATKAPIVIAPAMNNNMYTNPAVQENIKTLKNRGYYFVEPKEGRLACGTYGKGALANPTDIVDFVKKLELKKRKEGNII